MPKVIIANTLTDGFVAFLTRDGQWSPAIADSAVAASDDEAEALLAQARAAEQANVVVEPYLIDVALDGPQPRPLEYREFIRANGPSVPVPS